MEGRKEFVDWARGFAVLAMVLWHTADGWIAPALRDDERWTVLRFIGGLAAPSFLFLAGTASALAHRSGAPRPLLADLARGLEVMLLGYVLRYQAWLIDAAAITQLGLARAFVPLGAGYALLFLALRRRERALPLALAGACACALGFAQVPGLAPGRLGRLLQVDVLQAIGASLVLLALGQRRFALLERPRLLAVVALATTALTAGVYRLLPGVLPVFLAAYLGKFQVAPPDPAPTLFPLFPWFAYASLGAAYGAALKRGELAAIVVRCAVLGALLCLTTSESYQAIRALIAAQAWTVYPLRFVYRVGLLLVLLGIGWLWAENDRGRALIRLGRASLRVYWAHLLVAYGVLGSSLRHRLDFTGWCVGFALLLGAMWLLAGLPSRARVRPAPLPST